MEQLSAEKIYYCRDEIEQDIDDAEHDYDSIQLQLQTYNYSPERYESHEDFNVWKARATFSLSEKARDIRRLERFLRAFDKADEIVKKQNDKKEIETNLRYYVSAAQ